MTVELDPVLLEVLACPAPDHGPLTVGTPTDPDATVLSCGRCGRQYPVRDGIPVLLLDDAVLPAEQVPAPGSPAADAAPGGAATDTSGSDPER